VNYMTARAGLCNAFDATTTATLPLSATQPKHVATVRSRTRQNTANRRKLMDSHHNVQCAKAPTPHGATPARHGRRRCNECNERNRTEASTGTCRKRRRRTRAIHAIMTVWMEDAHERRCTHQLKGPVRRRRR
jgi:hypothetical protein